jgi:hypothetical protein
MIKHEIKVELGNSEDLKQIIQKTYFEEGFAGKISGKKHFLSISQEDDVNWTIFSGLNNATVKVTNDEIIDGTMRFIVDETEGDLRLYPISIYCIEENNKYIFY